MARSARRNGHAGRANHTTKYDENNVVLDRTYGEFADLRRQLADSKEAVTDRKVLLETFASCDDPQRAWLLLEDYLEKLSLARKDFSTTEWWPKILAARGKDRLEETAMLFLQANRPLPSELMEYANFDRFAELELEEQDHHYAKLLEGWLVPERPVHLDAPRATLAVLCQLVAEEQTSFRKLRVEFHVTRTRSGEKTKSLDEILDLTARASHEQEMFSPEDWRFITWLSERHRKGKGQSSIVLEGKQILEWMSEWGDRDRLLLEEGGGFLRFQGRVGRFVSCLVRQEDGLSLGHSFELPDGVRVELSEVCFFSGMPLMVLWNREVFLVKDAPSPELILFWTGQPLLCVTKLSHRVLTHLRKVNREREGEPWEELCEVHSGKPVFSFDLKDEVVQVRLRATSERDGSLWEWSGHEWHKLEGGSEGNGRPEILDDVRSLPAARWLRLLDLFTPEPGLWLGDANEAFLMALARAWPDRPREADYLGNPYFQRLFLSPSRLRPRLVLHGSGIDWLSVSTEWEIEGMRLTRADLERLQTASGRFVKLPDSGWMELDGDSLRQIQETCADLGMEYLSLDAQRVPLVNASRLGEDGIARLGNGEPLAELKERLKDFKGVPSTELPSELNAELRPYQKEGFDFLCQLSRLRMGGILADDMGLGKTLQTLSWLGWKKESQGKKFKPALVICPASVLHNWRREANRFMPSLRVLILESGAARHNLRKQIPENDLIITNYSLLRRDQEALQKFSFSAIILDEAQFIKNPTAQITQSVKQLNAEQRLALTGTPLENRLLDLWSILDFIQPNYLGTQAEFMERYEPKGIEGGPEQQSIALRRLSARIRPFLLRRLKKQVAQDLPDRIEERRDCELHDEQRKLYLAELRRSREQVMKTIEEKGVGRSRMHVLAALTRLRQVCCHPGLVGSDSPSGKTDTLFELVEPLVEKGQKVLVFSQFVKMLRILEKECERRGFPTHVLTGETKNRQEIVNQFQEDGRGGLFLLSLRAAGTGLNLTTASYVVLYDPWWNPAVEAQAIDRSHRIGQTNTVNAYRLISPGTVEEKIYELQQNKAKTISDVLGEEGFSKNLTEYDLEFLFQDPEGSE